MEEPVQIPVTSAEIKPKSPLPIIIVAVVIVIVVLLLGYNFFKQSKNPITNIVGSAAIEVNGQQISREFFNHRVEIQENFYKLVNPNGEKLKSVKKDEADAIVNALLLEQELKSKNLLPTDTEINAAVAKSQENYEKTATTSAYLSYEAFLKEKYKMNLQDRYYVEKKQLMEEKVAKIQVQKRMFGIWFARVGPLDDPNAGTDAEKLENQKKLELAEQALVEVKNTNDIAPLVAKYSEDPISKPKGGEIGLYPDPTSTIALSEPKFAAMAILSSAYDKLGVGEADIFQYPSGFAIIKVTEVVGEWQYKDIRDFYVKAREKAKIAVNINLD